MRPLKIGVACYPTFGGSGAVAADLASELAARGHEVHVVSYATPVRYEPRPGLFFHEVDVSSYPLFKFPRDNVGQTRSDHFRFHRLTISLV